MEKVQRTPLKFLIVARLMHAGRRPAASVPEPKAPANPAASAPPAGAGSPEAWRMDKEKYQDLHRLPGGRQPPRDFRMGPYAHTMRKDPETGKVYPVGRFFASPREEQLATEKRQKKCKRVIRERIRQEYGLPKGWEHEIEEDGDLLCSPVPTLPGLIVSCWRKPRQKAPRWSRRPPEVEIVALHVDCSLKVTAQQNGADSLLLPMAHRVVTWGPSIFLYRLENAVLTYNIGGISGEAYPVFCDWLVRQREADIVLVQELHWGCGQTEGTWLIGKWQAVVSADPANRFCGVGICSRGKSAGAAEHLESFARMDFSHIPTSHDHTAYCQQHTRGEVVNYGLTAEGHAEPD
ncbi:hypothetical protein AK812_SmicGene38185 [Symbiodinium microadriaticum]|uniref:Endonuclease/exonuclease/phosphatase domain-containing protein n=1 Tax=Symbiodinium microadriaticum TaxID=2951 RepID=A0A1Q9CEH4_SYMMI|nr:hypothetical protein AK812_SmicGene38185 [Symbiodinium microadriaticum]